MKLFYDWWFYTNWERLQKELKESLQEWGNRNADVWNYVLEASLPDWTHIGNAAELFSMATRGLMTTGELSFTSTMYFGFFEPNFLFFTPILFIFYLINILNKYNIIILINQFITFLILVLPLHSYNFYPMLGQRLL